MEDNNPRISVVVPVYNVEKYLHKCVDSILAQTFRDIKLILADDGSTDGSGAICDEYALKDERVRVIHKANGGVSSARNAGIEAAKGEWLCFVDSDDWIDETYLEDFGIDKEEADLYMQGYKEVNPNGTVLRTHFFRDYDYYSISEIIKDAEKQYIINSPCFKLFRTRIVKEKRIEFDVKTSYGEDHLFNYEFLRYTEKIISHTSVGYNVNRGIEGSLSTKVIPFEQISYFADRIFEIQHEYYLQQPQRDSSLMRVFKNRLYLNIRRMISDCQNTGMEKQLCLQIKTFILRHKNDLLGIGVKHMLLLAYFVIVPAVIQKFISK